MKKKKEQVDPFEGLELEEGLELLPDPRTAYAPIPRRVIKRLISKKLIDCPATPEQDIALKFLQKVWKDDRVFRAWFADMPKKERLLLAHYPQWGKIERFVFRLFQGADENGKKIKVEEAQKMIKKYYKVDFSMDDIKQVRQAYYNLKTGARSEHKIDAFLEAMQQE